MKIVINAVSAKMGGAVTYLTNLLQHLPSPESGHEFCVFLPPETARQLNELPKNVKLVPTNMGHARWWKRFWWEQVTLRRYLRKVHAEALFSTANFSMFRCPIRQILLVRNALYFSSVYRQRFLRRHNWRFRVSFALQSWLCRRSIRWADVVMTPTQALLDDVRQYVDVSEDKGRANHYGVAVHKDMGSWRPREEQSPIRLLYISLYAEHKNLTTLLRALPVLNNDGIGKFALTTTVNPAWEPATWMITCKSDMELAQRRDVASRVKFVGPLAPKEIEEQYRCADIFVFPSHTESFGHPLVEAMAHGLPIIASDTPVNREMCGDAAIYFSPLDPAHLARAIRQVATNQALQNTLSLAGWQRVRARFLWQTHVTRILQIAQMGEPDRLPEPLETSLPQTNGDCRGQVSTPGASLAPPDLRTDPAVPSTPEQA